MKANNASVKRASEVRMLDLAHVWLPSIINVMHERVNMNWPATKVFSLIQPALESVFFGLMTPSVAF